MKKRIQIISILLLCIYVVAVGYLCLMEPDGLPSLPVDFFGIPLDKIAHFTMFFPFPILAWFSFDLEKKSSKHKAILLFGILLTGCLMAIMTEFLQKMTDYRTFDMKDFYADITGLGLCWLGIATGAFINKRKKSRTE